MELIQTYANIQIDDYSSQEQYLEKAKELIKGDDYVFKIWRENSTSTFNIQLILNQNSAEEIPNEEWSTYVDSFLHAPTAEPIDLGPQKPFLNRNVNHELSEHDIVLKNGMQFKLKVNSYIIEYIQDTEDVFERIRESAAVAPDLEALNLKVHELLSKAVDTSQVDAIDEWYEIEPVRYE
eukprot:NODE_57_length_28844_cov_0.352687.p19 type:complete len:180 gc:universal NODE_57_length_28844_cov_0.352687:22459-22998(+)